MFALGLFKKLVLADQAAGLVDPVFQNVRANSGGLVLCAVILYTVQIYGDFSGYTDMGRGAARMCGIALPENFQSPYLSGSISEFWRRWHMTLGRWLCDYVYFPLGGSREGFTRGLFNLMLTMALCGLWHGAALNFVLWGAYHGVLMVTERISRERFGVVLPASLAIPLTLLLVMIGWVLFRAERLSDVPLIFTKIAAVSSTGFGVPLATFAKTAVLFSITICVQVLEYNASRVREIIGPRFVLRGAATAALAVTAIVLRGQAAPFIYFAF